jgi:hypothetical protein
VLDQIADDGGNFIFPVGRIVTCGNMTQASRPSSLTDAACIDHFREQEAMPSGTNFDLNVNSSSNLRMAASPIMGALVGKGDSQQGRLLECATNQLKPDGQAFAGESAGN